MRVTTTWRNDNPTTIWNVLAAKLGRQPTNEEAKADVLRILREASPDADPKSCIHHFVQIGKPIDGRRTLKCVKCGFVM